MEVFFLIYRDPPRERVAYSYQNGWMRYESIETTSKTRMFVRDLAITKLTQAGLREIGRKACFLLSVNELAQIEKRYNRDHNSKTPKAIEQTFQAIDLGETVHLYVDAL